MKTSLLVLFAAPLIVYTGASYPSAWPWAIEKPQGVELEGELIIEGVDSITNFGSTLTCMPQRLPILKREWMFDDKPISYDWQEPLDAAFEYSVPPTSNYATVMKSFPTSRNYKMTIHARMRHETYYDDGMKFTPKPTSHAYSYGEKEICTGD